MDESLRDFAGRLEQSGTITLTDDERLLVRDSIRALGAAESQIMLHARLLESHGQDMAQVDRLLGTDLLNAFGPGHALDLSAHARARDTLRNRLDNARSGAEWIAAVLDFVRVAAL